MEVSAKARYIRMSPRKVRLVVDVVRGMDLAEAQSQLSFMNKAAALPVLKLINSAAANAEHNFKLKPADLFVKTIKADGGPTLKRFKPRARGRAAPIRKRTTHITVVLDEKEKVEKKPEVKKEIKKEKKKPAVAKAKAGKETKSKNDARRATGDKQ